MSRRAQQEQHRADRARVLSEDDIYRRVFAEVVAAQQGMGMLGHDEDVIAQAVTREIAGQVATGMTESERRDAIVAAVARHLDGASR